MHVCTMTNCVCACPPCRQKEQSDAEAERAAVELEAKLEVERQAQKRGDDHRKALTTQLLVQTQMVAKAHIRAAEEDDKLRALEVSAQTEAAFMEKVSWGGRGGGAAPKGGSRVTARGGSS